MDLILLEINCQSMIAKYFKVSQSTEKIKLLKSFEFTSRDFHQLIVDIPRAVEIFQKALFQIGFEAGFLPCCPKTRKIIILGTAKFIQGEGFVYRHQFRSRINFLNETKKAKKEIRKLLAKSEKELFGILVDWIKINGYQVKKIDKLSRGEIEINFYLTYASKIYYKIIKDIIKELKWEEEKIETLFIPNSYILSKSVFQDKKNGLIIALNNQYFEISLLIDGIFQPIFSGQIAHITDLPNQVTGFLNKVEEDRKEILPALPGVLIHQGCYSEVELRSKVINLLQQESNYFSDFSLQPIESIQQKLNQKIISQLIYV